MKILELIAKWRKGCQLSPHNPIGCSACTETLINKIEDCATISLYSACITPKLHATVKNLQDVLSVDQNNKDSEHKVLVRSNDLESLLHEFFRLDMLLRQHNPTVQIDYQEEHRVT